MPDHSTPSRPSRTPPIALRRLRSPGMIRGTITIAHLRPRGEPTPAAEVAPVVAPVAVPPPATPPIPPVGGNKQQRKRAAAAALGIDEIRKARRLPTT